MWKVILVSSIGIAGILVLYRIIQVDSGEDTKSLKSTDSEPSNPKTNLIDLTPQEENETETIQPSSSEEYNWRTSDSTAINNGPLTGDISVKPKADWSHPKNSNDIIDTGGNVYTPINHGKLTERHLFKGKVRCKYWPDCAFEKSVFQTDLPNNPKYPTICEFWHPDIKCENNNQCQYEKHCMFWHERDFLTENRPYYSKNQNRFNFGVHRTTNANNFHNENIFKGQQK